MRLSPYFTGLPIYGLSSKRFLLPDIPENERIKVNTPKTRKHATKRRRNKLHDKKMNNRGKND